MRWQILLRPQSMRQIMGNGQHLVKARSNSRPMEGARLTQRGMTLTRAMRSSTTMLVL